jgi:hypothetical protein
LGMSCGCRYGSVAASCGFGTGHGPQRIGGFRSTLRRIGKEAKRNVDRVTDAVGSAAEKIGNEAKRAHDSVAAETRRTFRNIERTYDEGFEEVDQFVRQTGKHGVGGHLLEEFRRNPELFAVVGAVMMLIPGVGWMIGGVLLSAAASIRAARNQRKDAERAGGNGVTPEAPGGDVWSGIQDALGKLAEWAKANPVLAAAVVAAAVMVLRKRRGR